MKKLIIAVTLAFLSINAYSVTKCENTTKGMCCWDTDRDGPFKPMSCY